MDVIRAGLADLEGLTPLAAAFRAVLRSFKGEDQTPDEGAAREELAEFLEKGFPVFAAVEDGAYLGYIVCRVDEPCLWVEHIYVLPGCRRRGVASRLFGEAEAVAAAMGEDTVFNYVHPNNDGMIAFLRAKGYTVLNMIEIRKPWRGEKLTTKIRVDGNTFDY